MIRISNRWQERKRERCRIVSGKRQGRRKRKEGRGPREECEEGAYLEDRVPFMTIYMRLVVSS